MGKTRSDGFLLSHLPIQWKLAAVISILIALMMAILAVDTLAVRSATQAQREADDLAQIINQANITARSLSRRQIALVRLVYDTDTASETAYEDANAGVSREFQALIELVDDAPKLRGMVQSASGLNDQWSRTSGLPMVQLARDLRSGTATTAERDARMADFLAAEALEGGSRRIASGLDALIKAVNERLDDTRDLLQDRETNLRFLNLLAVAVTVAAGVGAFFLSARFIARPLRQLSELMERLAQHDHSIDIPFGERRDEVGTISRALDVFKAMSLATYESDWVKSGVGELSAKIQQCTDLRDFANTLLTDLAPRLNAGVGVFFGFDAKREELSLSGSYGFRERRHMTPSYRLGEGLVGQCALERKPILLSPVPDDYIRIHSGTGEASPRCVLVMPILSQGRLLAVLELASFAPFDAMRQRLMDDAADVVGLSLDNLQRALRTSDLLEQSQRQAQELQVAEEELRVQQEELRTTNDQLQQQSQRLIASEEELRVQAEELQKSNADLRRHSDALTEQKDRLSALQQETELKAADLERANQYKSQFLANMSHELRTPLNSMLILSQDLAENRSGNLDEEQVESASIIHSSGSNLLRLINEILDLSKVEAGKMEVMREPVSVAAFTQRMERNFRHVAQDKGLDFTVTCAPGLPATFISDEGKLEQITNNLLGNAFKFTHQGAVTVTFVTEDDGKTLTIEVTDTGIGIPGNKLDAIFEAFEQVDASSRRQYGGTGLGLAISRSLAHLLGGTLTVRSTMGEGTTFRLRLPISIGEGEATRSAVAPAPVDRGLAPAPRLVPRTTITVEDDRDRLEKGKPLILVVEDDQVFARTLVNIVRRSGYQVLAAGDGESGLALARAHSPTGILLDIMLPGMDGWTVIEQLKQDPATRHIPVHIVSALEEAPRGRQMGAIGFLTKPVRSEQLVEALSALAHFAPGRQRRVLVVDDDEAARKAVIKLLSRDGVEVVATGSGEEAIARMDEAEFDCLVLDLGLPGMSGFDVLENLAARSHHVPVVIYSGREVTSEESLRLRNYTDSIVIKGALSPERLLDEVSLFLHSVRGEKGTLPDHPDGDLAGRHVLVVDDDMRNIYALAKVLRGKGMTVTLAQDGAKALAQLEAHPDVEMVLMDIMMPVMDGYEAMAKIRARGGAWARLPIIALTAKAMKDDREKCLAAGANDYMAKPIDVPRLISMIRAWLPHT
ncbi:response regulator [Aquabacter sp. L1I39]|uniref:response regulator n=1 Tax=Aquabacter sp. L1I39 TaxID=2820278 RepID=UPI001ADCCF82|nr:response regulator [Aquabacter sp. L1I39]QTL02234.1 response regulator [Aquabacter sp. L1I39]